MSTKNIEALVVVIEEAEAGSEGNAFQYNHIELDTRNGDLSATYDADTSGVAFAVAYGHVRSYRIKPLAAHAVNRLMREIEPLAQRVVGGARQWTDQDRGNVLTELNADAEAAEAEIESILNDAMVDLLPSDQVFEAELDYMEPQLPEYITAEMDDTAVEEAVVALIADNADGLCYTGYQVPSAVVDAAKNLRDRLREELIDA